MRLLILGGTRFLGRHLAEQALARGHRLTLLHRGQSGPELFPQAEHRLADRDADLHALADGQWDAVIDTSAYLPRQVRSVADCLRGRVGHYQLVSSISVYARFQAAGTAEDSPLQSLADPEVQVVTGETYGGLKALCEAEARSGFAGRCLISRPGLLVGPWDPTDRFTWWVRRIAAGGDVLAPGDPHGPVQIIDARDAAAWMLLQAERRTAGTFNLTGPVRALAWGEMLQNAVTTLNPRARLHWVEEAFVLAQGVAPWADLPVWLPQESASLHRVNIQQAVATGLDCRPLAQTLGDTAAWDRTRPPATPSSGPPRPAVGLSNEREAALLAIWRGRAV